MLDTIQLDCNGFSHNACLGLFSVLPMVNWPHTKTPKCSFRNAVTVSDKMRPTTRYNWTGLG